MRWVYHKLGARWPGDQAAPDCPAFRRHAGHRQRRYFPLSSRRAFRGICSFAHQHVPTPGPQVNELWHASQVSCLPRNIHWKNLATASGASLTLLTHSLTLLSG
jgi:hypothetical protein